MDKTCISSKGQVLVLIALAMGVLLALAGLAIDVGMAYGVKAKLNAALDVAAIAAGRAISRGTDVANREAVDYFNANYPTGLLGSTVTAPVTRAVHNDDGSWTIAVTSTASVPTNFFQAVGLHTFTFDVSATSTIRTLDLILVLDSSGSLNDPPTTPDLLRSAAKRFIGNFDPRNDRIGLIHFASGAVSDITITETKGFDLTAINNAIDHIAVTGSTTSEEGMRLAKAQLDNIAPSARNSLRAIVFFSDGAPNGVAGDFDGLQGTLYSDPKNEDPCGNGRAAWMYSVGLQDHYLGLHCGIATLPGTGYMGVNLQSENNPSTRDLTIVGGNIVNNRCNANMAARNMVENVASAARREAGSPIHVFTIGLGASLTNLEVVGCGYGSNESGENILRRLANVGGVDTYDVNQPSGLYVRAADATQLDNAFKQVANAILRLAK